MKLWRKQMEKIRERLHSIIYEIAVRGHKYRIALRVMMAVVVFVTSYMLILPAVTLDSDTASSQGGIDVPASAVSEESTEDTSAADVTADTEVTDNTASETDNSDQGEIVNDTEETSVDESSGFVSG